MAVVAHGAYFLGTLTVSFLRPRRRRRLRTSRPAGVLMRFRKPWVRFRLFRCGWKVLFDTCSSGSSTVWDRWTSTPGELCQRQHGRHGPFCGCGCRGIAIAHARCVGGRVLGSIAFSEAGCLGFGVTGRTCFRRELVVSGSLCCFLADGSLKRGLVG